MDSEKVISVATFPFRPFLLTVTEESEEERHFVIDTWEGNILDLDANGEFAQTVTWTAHKASKEEIEHFLREGKRSKRELKEK